jgi:hypothetical protein
VASQEEEEMEQLAQTSLPVRVWLTTFFVEVPTQTKSQQVLYRQIFEKLFLGGGQNFKFR